MASGPSLCVAPTTDGSVVQYLHVCTLQCVHYTDDIKYIPTCVHVGTCMYI